MEQVVIPKNKFPTGIAVFTLFKEGIPVSERLIFIDRKDGLKIEMVPDKNEYGDREKIRLAMKVTDETGKPVEGSFSLSVTDDKVVSPSIDMHNIKGSLLLDADLKGYIENAGWYFAGEEELNGWRLWICYSAPRAGGASLGRRLPLHNLNRFIRWRRSFNLPENL